MHPGSEAVTMMNKCSMRGFCLKDGDSGGVCFVDGATSQGAEVLTPCGEVLVSQPLFGGD